MTTAYSRFSMLGAAALLLATAAPANAQWFGPRGWGYGGGYYEPGYPNYLPPEESDAPVRKPRVKERRETPVTIKEPLPGQPLQIVVSIGEQRVNIFSGTTPIAQAPVSTGVKDHPTPLGIFAVIAKARWHTSNIYSGAPMPFMQRITWSGIALHAGALPGHPASHGCIRLPEAFATRLFAMTKLGARVIIAQHSATPVAFAHAKLPAPMDKKDEPVAGVALRKAVEVAAAVTKDEATDATKNVTESATKTDVTPALAAPPDIIVLPANEKRTTADSAAEAAAANANAKMPKRKGPVQIFVSRKDKKIYLRQGFAPLSEAFAIIPDIDLPWGTHVFTAIEKIDDGKALRWSAITLPSGAPLKPEHGKKISAREHARIDKRNADLAAAPSAAQALERFDWPQDILDKIGPLLAPGSALIVSDNGPSEETGLETDFIVATR